MHKILVRDYTRCSGCRVCEVVCAFHHFGECNPSLARLIVVDLDGQGVFVPQICRHCKEPWCMNECPVDAIVRDTETGAIVIVNELCTGCHACGDACPFGMIRISPLGDVFKCDLCQGSPECVKFCTRRALKYIQPTDAYVEKAVDSAGKLKGAV